MQNGVSIIEHKVPRLTAAQHRWVTKLRDGVMHAPVSRYHSGTIKHLARKGCVHIVHGKWTVTQLGILAIAKRPEPFDPHVFDFTPVPAPRRSKRLPS